MTQSASQDPAERIVLFLGGHNAGKSTYLNQVYARIRAGSGAIRPRGAASDLTLLQEGLGRLSRGLPLGHTPHATQATQSLPVVDAKDEAFDIVLPEYAGESLRTMVAARRISQEWQVLIRAADQWLLFLRLDQIPQTEDILTRPLSQMATKGLDGDGGSTQSADGSTDLPEELRTIELLQFMHHVRGSGPRLGRMSPSLTVVLSCWDELGLPQGTEPGVLLSERLPALHSFLSLMWAAESLTILGLSAQGQKLVDGEPDQAFVEQGPHTMGWVILPDGRMEKDLTIPLVRG